MNETDLLVRDHALVLLALDLLVRAADPDSGASDTARARLLEFFEQFLDEHHHTKEEQGLFPAMIEAGFPFPGGPIAVMRSEHDQGRAHVVAMRRSLGADPGAFTESAHAFATVLGEHIEKENHVLFPMAQRFVSPATLARLAQGWDIDPGVEARWRDELASIAREIDTA